MNPNEKCVIADLSKEKPRYVYEGFLSRSLNPYKATEYTVAEAREIISNSIHENPHLCIQTKGDPFYVETDEYGYIIH